MRVGTRTFTAPVSGPTPHIWLRWPRVAVCTGESLAVYEESGEEHQLLRLRFTASMASLGGGVPIINGKASNVVQGLDVRRGWLVAGTQGGRVLAIRLADAPADGSAWASPSALELTGHSKVVGFLRLEPSERCFYTSSMDRSVREWALPSGQCLQTVKVGTPVLELALLPRHAGADGGAQLLMGCGDGTLRLWEPAVKKASKAITPLRLTHDEYVGAILPAADGGRVLSCSRSGQLLLWRRDEAGRAAYVPDAAALPAGFSEKSAWRIELASTGLLSISPTGGATLFPWGGEPSRAALPHAACADALSSPLLEAHNHSALLTAPDGSASLVLAGIQPPPPQGGPATIVVSRTDSLRLEPPPADVQGAQPVPGEAVSTAGGGSAGGGSAGGGSAAPAPELELARWEAMAAEEGVAIGESLRAKLAKMTAVAAATGRELTEPTVRAALQRMRVAEG